MCEPRERNPRLDMVQGPAFGEVGAEDAFSWSSSQCASWISAAGFCSMCLEICPLNQAGLESCCVHSRSSSQTEGHCTWKVGDCLGEWQRRGEGAGEGQDIACLSSYCLFNLLPTPHPHPPPLPRKKKVSFRANSL